MTNPVATPRTDAVEAACSAIVKNEKSDLLAITKSVALMVDHARQLERELIAATAPSPDVAKVVEELDALEAKVCRAPWKATFDDDHYSKKDGVYISGNPTGALGGMRELGTFYSTYCKPTPHVEFVVALRNAWPLLRAALSRQQADAGDAE